VKSVATIVALLAGLVLLVAVWIPRAIGAERVFAEIHAGRTSVGTDGHVREYGYGQIRFNGRGPEAWRWTAVGHYEQRRRLERQVAQLRRQLRQARRELRRRHEESSLHAIALASVAYNVDERTLVRKARCETGGTFSPFAANPRSSARGLFQFLTTPRGGTWATTPYRRFSVFDRYANALAAAWMHSADVRRGGEWECR
jgi:hypothetical protein